VRVLITGFGPFPGAPLNPSATLAKALARRRRPAFAALDRAVHIFETTYGSVDRELPKLLAQKPDIVLMFGVAGRRRQLCVETRARNALCRCYSRMLAAIGRNRARSIAASPRRLKATHHSRDFSARREREPEHRDSRAMPDAIFAIISIGSHWNIYGRTGHWFNLFTFRH